MANETEEISWAYKDKHPHMGIRLVSPGDIEYPVGTEELVLLDTGWSGGIVLPIRIYEQLELQRWEKPDIVPYELADGSDMNMYEAEGFLFVPKLNNRYEVAFYRSVDKGQDSNEILLGIDFINNFKLLLDGPAQKLSVIK